MFVGRDGAVEVEKFLDEGIGGEVADFVRVPICWTSPLSI